MVFKRRQSARQPTKGRLYKRFGSLLLVTVMVAGIMLFGPATIFAPRASASALSFICASSAAATSTAACAGEAAGDLLLVTAGTTASGTIPTLAAGFTNINTAAITTGPAGSRIALRAGWITAAASSTTSGTWTNATDVVMQVYRGQAGSPIGNNAPTTGTATSVTYAADTLVATDASSWFTGSALRNTADSLMSTAPSGMINRSSAPATPVIAGHDTNGPDASNWPSTNVTGFGASASFASIVVELKAAPAITVGTSGTQLSNLTIPSANGYVGGAFNFVRDVGTANITSIKIHDSGSVVANTNISNVILLYKQEAVCSSSIPSGTTQFNSTPGTFNASEDSTVTGTIAVDTSQICVYVQLNVGSGAAGGNTLDLQITNPSTDVIVSVGTASPASAVVISGSGTLSLPTANQFLRGGELFSGEAKQRFYWAQ
jgi:hypothetical protein